MILYESNEKEFTSQGLANLSNYAFDDLVTEELNGIFKLEFTYPMFAPHAKDLTFDRIVKASTPDSEQPFFIAKTVNKDGYLAVTCYHLFYRLLWELIPDIYIQNMGGQAALVRILENTGFTGIADTTIASNLRIVRYNVVQAIMGDEDNTLINRFGGEIVRDKFLVNLKNKRGRPYEQNPVEIRYAKNLESYEVDIDSTNVATRVMPLGFDGLKLPENYVERPGFTAPFKTVLREYPDIKAQKEGETDPEALPLAEAEQALREAVLKDFQDGTFDVKANYKISFVELSKTEEYKNKAVLERIYLGDEIRVIHTDEDIDILARVIAYRWIPSLKEYQEVELGNYIPKFTDIRTSLDIISGRIDEIKSNQQLTVDHVTDLITNALGGYVKTINGEMFIMDTDDPSTAKKVWRWNINGLGYSGTGVNGPYETAITMDGHIVGKFITANSITANQLSSDVGQSLDLTGNTSIRMMVPAEVKDYLTANPPAKGEDGKTPYIKNGTWWIGDVDTGVKAEATDGKDGTFTWVKYSDDKVSLSDTDSGQRYLGIAPGKTTATESTNPADYIWLDRTEVTEQVIMGSTNLIRYDQLTDYNAAVVDKSPYLTSGTVAVTSSTSTYSGLKITIDNPQPLTQYILSFDVTKISGTLQQIGGSTDQTWVSNEVYVDGVKQAGKWNSAISMSAINTGGTAKIDIKLVTPSIVSATHAIYIMPNWGITVQAGIRVDRLRLYEGNSSPSNWTPNPLDPIKQGIFEVTPDGWKTSNNVDGVSMYGDATGIRVKDNITGNTVMEATSAGLMAPVLNAGQVFADNLTNSIKGIYDCYVDGRYAGGDFSGRDWNNRAGSVRDALNYVMGQAKILDGAIINVYLRNSTAESLILEGLVGKGTINIKGYSQKSKLIGCIAVKNCGITVNVDTMTLQRPVESTQELVSASRTLGVTVTNCLMDGGGSTTNGIGVGAYDGATVYVKGCTMANFTYCLNCSTNGQIMAEDNKGSFNTYASNVARGGKVTVQGTYPESQSGNRKDIGGWQLIATGASVLADPFALSPPSFSAQTRVFTARLRRKNIDSGYTSPGEFAQGTSPNSGDTYIGYADFGDDISSWLKDNGGYSNLQAMTISAKRGNWGYDTDGIKFTSPSTLTTSAVGRGDVSTVTVATGTAMFTAIETSTNLVLSTSTTSTTDYSDWEYVTIKITVDKKG